MIERPSLHALALYLAVVEHGTMIAAAEAEGISQPAISTQVKSLEGYYRTPLLERRGRRVYPTPAGQIVANSARRILNLVAELDRAIADLDELRAGELVVGASATVGETVLPEVLGRFQRAYPAVEVALRLGNSQDIVRAIHERGLSFGVVGRPVEDTDLVAQPVFEDHLDLFVRPNHPACARRSLRLADLAAETFVLREPDSATRELALTCLTARAFVPAHVLQLGSNEAVKRAVAAGLGIGILSAYTLSVDQRVGDIAPLHLLDWDCRRQFWLVQRRDGILSRAEKAFLHLLKPTSTP